MTWGLAYLAGLCLLIGAAIYALLCKLDPLDDPFSNGPHGDWPFVPTDDFKAPHHDKGFRP